MELWFSEFHTPDVKRSIRVDRQSIFESKAPISASIFLKRRSSAAC